MPKILEITLHNGVDPSTGARIGIPTGDPGSYESFEELFGAFVEQLKFFISVKTTSPSPSCRCGWGTVSRELQTTTRVEPCTTPAISNLWG
jgi:hypothetical protein